MRMENGEWNMQKMNNSQILVYVTCGSIYISNLHTAITLSVR